MNTDDGKRMRLELERLRREVAELRDRVELAEISERMASVGSWSWDFAKNSVRWSDEMFRIFQVDPDNFDGTPEGATMQFHPEDQHRAEEGVRRGLAGKDNADEYRVLWKDGTIRYVWGHGEVVRDEDGQPIRMVGTILDITGRKRAEKALRASRERLALALDASNMGIWEWDLQTHRLDWSDTTYRLYGVDRDSFEASYEKMSEIVHPDDLARVDAEVREAIANPELPQELESEHRAVRSDGQIRWLYSKGRIYWSADGVPQKMRGIVLDVTDRKRMEDELNKSQRLDSIGRLAGGIAHDFNNLLTVIMGSLSWAEKAITEDTDPREHLAAIQSAADHAARLTTQLLAFARRQYIDLRPIDMNTVVAEVDQLLHRVLGEDIELATDMANDLWPVKADRAQIEQVLINLAVNAREAMPEGGRLSLTSSNVRIAVGQSTGQLLRRPGDYVRLEVSDTGQGIEADSLLEIFEPFYTTKEKGSGMGLASCYGIINQVGGYITALSEPGAGTTFVVDLPRSQEPAKAATPTSVEPSQKGRETVLVVEDEPDVRNLVVRVLRDAGYVVLEASDGVEALDVSNRHSESIDLLVTDAVMPRMGGLELAEQIRREREDLDVLIISGYVEKLRSFENHGRYAFLQKPFDPRKLLASVRERLDI